MTTTEKKKVVLYVRVSTDEQALNQGAEYQEEEMKKYFNEDQYEIVETYQDLGYSGASEIEERDGLPKLFEAAKNGEFDIVAVWKVDRFFRRTSKLLAAIEDLTDYKVAFIATSQVDFNTLGNMGKFLLACLAAIAEMERDMILERTALGKKRKADKGFWVGGKTPPYGYDVNPNTQLVEINEEEAKMVRKIFHWYVNEGMTRYAIGKRLNTMGILTKADKKDRQLKKEGRLQRATRSTNGECFWSDATITKMMKNTAYTGVYYYNKTKRVKVPGKGKTEKVNRPREEWIELTCPAIITKELFDKAQQKAEENKKIVGRKYEYFLSGKITCGQCGGIYQGYMKKKKKNRKVIAEYPQYRCKKKGGHRVQERCTNREVSGTVLDELIWGEVKSLLQNPKAVLELYDKRINEEQNVKATKEEAEILEKEIQHLEVKYNKKFELFENQKKYSSFEELNKDLIIIEKELDVKRKKLKILKKMSLTKKEQKERLESINKIKKFYEGKLDNLDFETKKKIIQPLVHSIVVNNGNAKATLAVINTNKTDTNSNEDRHSCSHGKSRFVERNYGRSFRLFE